MNTLLARLVEVYRGYDSFHTGFNLALAGQQPPRHDPDTEDRHFNAEYVGWMAGYHTVKMQ